MIRFSNEEFEHLTKYLMSQYGIDLSKKKILAECRMNSELEKRQITSLTQFMKMMEADKTHQLENAMLNRLTTNYTYFMREPKHFEYLTREILTGIRPEGHAIYRAWCAGCSSGEECYTLAMVLQDYKDQGGFLPLVAIMGSDISQAALDAAQKARYPIRELDNIPDSWRKKYITIEPDEYFEIKPMIKSQVSFQQMNLLQSGMGPSQYDLILCRNVMIYFNEKSRKILIERLYRALAPGGYLFVGHTEMMSKDYELFHYVCPAVYRK